MDCNWKVFCDNYLDGGYHVPFAHPALASGVAMRSYETEIYGLISVQRVRARLDDESDEARVEDVDVAGSKSADAPVDEIRFFGDSWRPEDYLPRKRTRDDRTRRTRRPTTSELGDWANRRRTRSCIRTS